MDQNDVPTTKEKLYNKLRKMKHRDYAREYGVDRKYALQLHAFGRNHPEFLFNSLVELGEKKYSNIAEKIKVFFELLDKLSEDEELRIKLQHKSLEKTL